jgi:hypothetical protein
VRPKTDGQARVEPEAHPTSAGAAGPNAKVEPVSVRAPGGREKADRPAGRRRAMARRRTDEEEVDLFSFADPVTSDEFYCISANTATLSTVSPPRTDPKTKAGWLVCVTYT